MVSKQGQVRGPLYSTVQVHPCSQQPALPNRNRSFFFFKGASTALPCVDVAGLVAIQDFWTRPQSTASSTE